MSAVSASTVFALFCGYLLLMSLLAFALYAIDKSRARRGAWRIPERTLILLAYLGGAPGAWIAMTALRHKTKHMKFLVLVPLAFVLWAGLGIWLAIRSF